MGRGRLTRRHNGALVHAWHEIATIDVYVSARTCFLHSRPGNVLVPAQCCGAAGADGPEGGQASGQSTASQLCRANRAQQGTGSHRRAYGLAIGGKV